MKNPGKKMKRVLVTAGPTREKIDSVRFISNRSTGRMGYEIARASLAKGYKVTLISGPTYLKPPKGAGFVPVEDARQMGLAVKKFIKGADCLFMAGAVADWRPADPERGKIKKGKKSSLNVRLRRNPDILERAGRNKGAKILAGFALESDGLLENARKKLESKNLDFIAANKVGARTPFGGGRVDITVIDKYGASEKIANATKRAVAGKLLRKAESLWAKEASRS
jgi:phosphopantothenoylcysteine decarboxylase/phosphopantothenate--cysteine ligase